jgi:hypothetical protein
MMEKLAQPGEGTGARPPPFTISTVPSHTNGAVYAPAERADTLPLFLLYPYMYFVFSTAKNLCLFTREPSPYTVKKVFLF